MSRFNRVLGSSIGWWSKFAPTVLIDFGSSHTKVMIHGQLVWHQPSLIAWQTEQARPIVVGQAAAQLRGKLPAKLALAQPIQVGVVADLDLATAYLTAILNFLKEKGILGKSWLSPRVIMTAPTAISPVERTQLELVCRQAGFSVVKIINKPEALINLTVFDQVSQAHGVIDFGADTVEFALYQGKKVLMAKTFKTFLDQQLTQVVIDQVKANNELVIGVDVAHKLLEQIGSIFPRQQPLKLTVSGKKGQQLTTVTLSDTVLQPHIEVVVSKLMQVINQALTAVSPELLTQLREHGFYLTGGWSQLAGWSELFTHQLGVPVILSTHPHTDLVRSLNDQV